MTTSERLTDEEFNDLEHGSWADGQQLVRKAAAEIRELRAALDRIKQTGCQKNCKSGKLPSKKWCGSCIADAALKGAE